MFNIGFKYSIQNQRYYRRIFRIFYCNTILDIPVFLTFEF